jgi:hypothetical protein
MDNGGSRNVATTWKFSVLKSLSTNDQMAFLMVKVGLVTQCISFLVAMPLLYWLRKEFSNSATTDVSTATRG